MDEIKSTKNKKIDNMSTADLLQKKMDLEKQNQTGSQYYKHILQKLSSLNIKV